MTKFLFKSSQTSDFQKLSNTLEVVLNEQRHQRSDLAFIIRGIKELTNNKALQTQVDDYHDPLVQDPPQDE